MHHVGSLYILMLSIVRVTAFICVDTFCISAYEMNWIFVHHVEFILIAVCFSQVRRSSYTDRRTAVSTCSTFQDLPQLRETADNTKRYTQDVSWLEDITAPGNFLGLSDQKSSYKHVSDFGRLRSYGHFLIPVHVLVWTASHGTSWRVMYSTWRLIFCVVSIIFATCSRISQPSGSLCCGRRWHFRKPALSTDQFKLKVISRR